MSLRIIYRRLWICTWPKFDEESRARRHVDQHQPLWRALWQKEIDVRAQIIRPALEKGSGMIMRKAIRP